MKEDRLSDFEDKMSAVINVIYQVTGGRALVDIIYGDKPKWKTALHYPRYPNSLKNIIEKTHGKSRREEQNDDAQYQKLFPAMNLELVYVLL
jgi:hypothetical protein